MKHEAIAARGFVKNIAGAREMLAILASGNILVSFDRDGEDGLVEEINGKVIVDEKGQKPRLIGVTLLYSAGYIDQFGVVTPEGRDFLAASKEKTA